jgi:hypothetical protein
MAETDLQDASASRTGARSASVRIRLDTLDVDDCGNEVAQSFAGEWSVELVDGVPTLTDADIEKVAGDEPVINCPEPLPPTTTTSTTDCHPDYPDVCLDPNSPDYDCASGSGDGPDYIDGPLTVQGSDEFGLDSDANGVGCET